MKLCLSRLRYKYLASVVPCSAKALRKGESHTYTLSVLLCLSFVIVTNHSSAQDSLPSGRGQYPASNGPLVIKDISSTWVTDPNHYRLSNKQIRNRTRLVAAGNIIGYGGTMIGLNAAWYADYPRSNFHTFNDNKEWLQVDKVGHTYSAYLESNLSMEMWRWAGVSRNKRIWYGGLSGAVYQTVIETLDGFSKEWGWSWGDFAANVVGSGTVIAQELVWDEQRIKLKFSFHKNDYGSDELNNRANKLFGKSITERLLKDYNAQTYWVSANLKSFMPEANLPGWLSVAVGYGANGMFGGTENIGKDPAGNINFSRTDIKRYRQWYLAPDIDFTKISTNKKALKVLFVLLNCFKFPAPSIQLSNGKFKVNAVTF